MSSKASVARLAKHPHPLVEIQAHIWHNNPMKLSLSSENLNTWLDRAEKAYEEFLDKDASQTTEAQLWEDIARRYDLPEDLDDFVAMQKHLKEADESLEWALIRNEIEKSPNEFFKLKRAWKAFVNKYGPKIKHGEISKLWSLFCGDAETEKWGRLRHEQRLAWKDIRREEMGEIVKKFGLTEFEDYKQIITDKPFIERLQTKTEVKRVISKKAR